MGPIKKNSKKETITIETKKEIIEKYESGVRVCELSKKYNKSSSTICTILKKKDELKALDVAKGVSRIMKQRPQVLEDIEKTLLVWINERQLAGEVLTEALIREKAKALYSDLINKTPGVLPEDYVFKVSRGWFKNFKRRSGILNVAKLEESASYSANAIGAIMSEFRSLIDAKGYRPQQVFNCDETGIFWKKIPKLTYVMEEDKRLAGHVNIQDWLTFLFCTNASGDFKVDPLLVYHSDNLQIFKKCNFQNGGLNAMWKANSDARVDRIFFIEWINEVFGPSVKQYLQERNLPLKVLLVMDNSPAHPPELENYLMEEFKFIEVLLLPSNVASLLQPMEQGIIANFKKLYTKGLFQKCLEATERTNLTLREFWKEEFYILSCLKIIEKAWKGLNQTTLILAWGKLWPHCILECDFDSFNLEQEDPIIKEILALCVSLGLTINGDDIEELLEEYCREMTTDEFFKAHLEQQKEELVEELSFQGEDRIEESPTSNEIGEICRMWETVQNFVEKHHPNKEESGRSINIFNDNAMLHFRDIIKHRQKRMALDRLIAKLTPK